MTVFCLNQTTKILYWYFIETKNIEIKKRFRQKKLHYRKEKFLTNLILTNKRDSDLLNDFLRRPVDHLQVVDRLRQPRVRQDGTGDNGTDIGCKVKKRLK